MVASTCTYSLKSAQPVLYRIAFVGPNFANLEAFEKFFHQQKLLYDKITNCACAALTALVHALLLRTRTRKIAFKRELSQPAKS